MLNIKKNLSGPLGVKKLHIHTALAAVLILVFLPALAQAMSITGIGDLDGGGYYSEPNAISGDGSAIVGFSKSAGSPRNAYLWNASGMVDLCEGFENPRSEAYGVSQDGSVAVGTFNTNNAVLWNRSSGTMNYLGTLDGYDQKEVARSVSGDGTVVAGYATKKALGTSSNQALIWTNGSAQSLGKLSSQHVSNSIATDLSRNGSVVVGKAYGNIDQAFVWTTGSGMTGLGVLSNTCSSPESTADAVSGDGKIVAGFSRADDNSKHAVIWDQDGLITDLHNLELGSESAALDISGNGSIVVGELRRYKGAFIWTKELGMVKLYDFLEGLGLEGLQGWNLMRASGISDDGLTITGLGKSPENKYEGWVVSLDKNTFAPVPVPGTLLLLGTGMAALAGLGRRKNNKGGQV